MDVEGWRLSGTVRDPMLVVRLCVVRSAVYANLVTLCINGLLTLRLWTDPVAELEVLSSEVFDVWLDLMSVVAVSYAVLSSDDGDMT